MNREVYIVKKVLTSKPFMDTKLLFLTLVEKGKYSKFPKHISHSVSKYTLNKKQLILAKEFNLLGLLTLNIRH